MYIYDISESLTCIALRCGISAVSYHVHLTLVVTSLGSIAL